MAYLRNNLNYLNKIDYQGFFEYKTQSYIQTV